MKKELIDAVSIEIRFETMFIFSFIFFLYVRINIFNVFFFQLVLHNDMETVYKTIPKETFPQDYGGSHESTDILLGKVSTDKLFQEQNNKSCIFDENSFYRTNTGVPQG